MFNTFFKNCCVQNIFKYFKMSFTNAVLKSATFSIGIVVCL